MNDYDALRDYLLRQKQDEFVLSFEQIEEIIGAALPRAANRASAGTPTDWVAWSTSHHLAQVRRWLDATVASSTRIPGQRRSLDGQLLEHPDF